MARFLEAAFVGPEGHITERDALLLWHRCNRYPLITPKQLFAAEQQLSRMEWLHQIILSTLLEAQDAVFR
jgi:hypothetical protein